MKNDVEKISSKVRKMMGAISLPKNFNYKKTLAETLFIHFSESKKQNSQGKAADIISTFHLEGCAH